MSPRRGSGPRCTVIWWGDIPSQVVVRDGEQTIKAELPARFQHAIDRAAMGGGQAGSDSYMAGWSRSERACSADLQAELDTEVAELDRRFPEHELERMIQARRAARRAAAAADRTDHLTDRLTDQTIDRTTDRTTVRTTDQGEGSAP
jgi:Virulence factor